jgi:hypothetical protein
MANPSDEARKSYEELSSSLGRDAALDPMSLLATYAWDDTRPTKQIDPPA